MTISLMLTYVDMGTGRQKKLSDIAKTHGFSVTESSHDGHGMAVCLEGPEDANKGLVNAIEEADLDGVHITVF